MYIKYFKAGYNFLTSIISILTKESNMRQRNTINAVNVLWLIS